MPHHDLFLLKWSVDSTLNQHRSKSVHDREHPDGLINNSYLSTMSSMYLSIAMSGFLRFFGCIPERKENPIFCPNPMRAEQLRNTFFFFLIDTLIVQWCLLFFSHLDAEKSLLLVKAYLLVNN